jgi:hypothetical protein
MTTSLKICMNYTAHLKLTKTGDYVISSKRRYTIILAIPATTLKQLYVAIL